MKYRQSVSNTTPVSVQIWLEDELERFGIDGAYTRYILSLLQKEPVTLDPSENNEKLITDLTYVRNGAKNIFVPFSKARHRGWKNWNRKWQNLQFDLVGEEIGMKGNQAGAEVKKGKEEELNRESPEYLDSEELKKLAAIECLITASEEAPKNEVGKVIDELCGYLKNWQADSESPKSLNMDPAPISTLCNYIQLQNGVLGNRHDLYNADFPALKTDSKENQLESIKEETPKVWESIRNGPIVEDDSGKEDSPMSDSESNSSEKENIVDGNKKMSRYGMGEYNYQTIRLPSPLNNNAISAASNVSTLYHSPFNGSAIENNSSSFTLFPQTTAVLTVTNQPALVKNSDVERELPDYKPIGCKSLFHGYYYKPFDGQVRRQVYKGWDKPSSDTKGEETERDLVPLNLSRSAISGGKYKDCVESEEPGGPNENHMFSATYKVWAPADNEALKFKHFRALYGNSEEKLSESSSYEDFSVAKSQESDNSSELDSFHGSSILDLDDGSVENVPDSHSEDGDDNGDDLYLDPVKIINKEKNLFIKENYVGVEDGFGSPLLTPKDLPPFQNAIRESAMHNLWGQDNFLGGINATTNGVWSGSDKIAAFYEKNYARIEDSISQDFVIDDDKMFNHSEGSKFKKFEGALIPYGLPLNQRLVSSGSKPSSILKKDDDEEEENLLTSENSHFAPIHPDMEDSTPCNSEYLSVTEIKIKKNHGAVADKKDYISKDHRKKTKDDLSAPLRVEDLEACSSDEDSGLEKVKILQAGFRSQTAVDRSNNTTPSPSRPVYLEFQLRTLEYGPRAAEYGSKRVKSPPAVELRRVSYTVSGNNPCWDYASKLFKTAGLPTGNDINHEDLIFGKPSWSTSDGSDDASCLGQREISYDPLAFSDAIGDINVAVANTEDDPKDLEEEIDEVGNDDNQEVKPDAVACAKLTDNFEKLCSLKKRVDPESPLYGKITAAIDNGWSLRTCDDETLACYEELIGNSLELPAIPTNNVLYSSELEDEWQRLSQPFDSQLPCKTKHSKLGDDWHSSLHQRPCSFYLEGNCHRFNCKFSHDLSRITCRFWEEGSCFKGLTCPFLHGYPSDEDFSPPLPLSPFLEEKSKPRVSPPVSSKWNFKLESEKDFPSLSASSLQDMDSEKRNSSPLTSDLIVIPKKLGNSSRKESGFGRIIRSKKSKKCFSNHLPISSSARNEVSVSSRGKNQDGGVATKKNVSATIRHDFALKI